MMYASSHSKILEGSVREALDWLRSRHHPEKPHISLIAPPSSYIIGSIWRGLCPQQRGITIRHDGEDEDEEVAEAADIDDASKHRYPGWVFGSAIKIDDSGGGSARVKFSFYIRVDSDDVDSPREDSYVRVDAEVAHSSSGRVEAIVKLSRGGRDLGEYTSGVKYGVGGCSAAAVVVGDSRTLSMLDRGALARIIRDQISLPNESLRVEVIDIAVKNGVLSSPASRGKKSGSLRHAFAIVVGLCSSHYRAYLLNLGGVVDGGSNITSDFCENPYRLYIPGQRGGFERWAAGYLLEVDGEVEFSGGWRGALRWDEIGVHGVYTANALVAEKEAGRRYAIVDYSVDVEVLYGIEKSSKTVDSFLQEIADEVLKHSPGPCRNESEFRGFINAIVSSLKEKGIDKLYTFQEEATRNILSGLGLLGSNGKRAVVIMSRTAGGKTLAFLIPILIYIAFERSCRGAREGVKAILAYPTKALANDQLEELADLLYRIYREVGSSIASFGVLHGEVKFVEQMQSPEVLPISCADHGDMMMVLQAAGAHQYTPKARVACRGKDPCDFAEFLDAYMRKARDEIYYSPPDILITDEDMINRIISGSAPGRAGNKAVAWWEWQLLGYKYKRCPVCRHTYPIHANIVSCRICGRKNILQNVEPSRPAVVVLDEAHQLYGSFGVQVHHLLSLLEHVMGRKPLYVLSSATLSRPREFAMGLLGLDSASYIDVVSAKEDYSSLDRAYRRIFAFVMPKAYTKEATIARLIEKFIDAFKRRAKSPPRGIVFTNTLGESNEVIQALRNSDPIRLALGSNERVDGHTTDYSSDRLRIEIEFKRGNIDWLVATSTLEVGVDYGVVDAVAIHGMPSKVTSFVQRIGRAGRKRDAAIFVVFNPDIPADYDFYRSYRILSDGKLRSYAIRSEVIEISPLNEEAVRRAVNRWIIAEVRKLCGLGSSKAAPDVCRIAIEGISNKDRRNNAWDHIIKHLNSAQPPPSISRIQNIVDITGMRGNIINTIKYRKQSLLKLADLIKQIGAESLHSLRGSDELVPLDFSGAGSRMRELRTIVKRGLRGEVIAFRGFFYMVDAVQQEESVSLDEWLK